MTKVFIISIQNYLPFSMDLTNKNTLSQIFTYFKLIAPILMIFAYVIMFHKVKFRITPFRHLQ